LQNQLQRNQLHKVYSMARVGLLALLVAPTAARVGRPQCAHAPPYPKCSADYPRQLDYSVSVVERDPFHGRPLIANANGDSDYAYNFNGPWFPPPAGSEAPDGLIVRVQENWRNPNATHPEWTDTGALTVIRANLQAGTAQYIDAGRVFWAGTSAPPHIDHDHVCEHPHPLCGWGAIDPRIRYRPKTQEYYLTWDNCKCHFPIVFRSFFHFGAQAATSSELRCFPSCEIPLWSTIPSANL
jgi:hypothetical protein